MMSVPSISALTAGISFSACDAGAHEEAHEAELDAVLLLEQLLVLVAHVHHRAHVDLVEGRQHGGGVLRLLQPPRDGLAQPRHLHALLARGVVGRRRRAHLHGAAVWATGVGCRGGALDRRHHVALGDPAVLAGARRRSTGSMPLSAAILRTEGASGISRLGRRRRARRLGFGRLDRRRGRGLAIGPPAGRAGRGGARAGAFLDLAEQRADRDGLAILGGNLGQHAGGRRRHLDRHLVGLELDQRLVDRDRIARLLEPFADRRLGDGFAERGNADFSHDLVHLYLSAVIARRRPGDPAIRGHIARASDAGSPGYRGDDDVQIYPSASSSNCFNCARCFDIWPTAVAADAGRAGVARPPVLGARSG